MDPERDFRLARVTKKPIHLDFADQIVCWMIVQ